MTGLSSRSGYAASAGPVDGPQNLMEAHHDVPLLLNRRPPAGVGV